MWINLLLILGCNSSICDNTIPNDATLLNLEVFPWTDGPEYDHSTGQKGGIIESSEAWQEFIAENNLVDPLPTIDFESNDLLIYERMHDGCEWDVVFERGAYLVDGVRYILAAAGEETDEDCNNVDPHHAILILEKVSGARYTICPVE